MKPLAAAQEGARFSLRESMEWLAFYVILFAALLQLRHWQLHPDPWGAVTAIAILAAMGGLYLLVPKENGLRMKSMVAVISMSMEMAFMTYGKVIPFSLGDILLWPGLTWGAAIVVTAGIASFARRPVFNQDLLPFVGSVWRNGLDIFGAVVLMTAALAFLLFFPEHKDFSEKIGSLLNQNPGPALPPSRESLSAVISVLADDFPRNIGLLGESVPFLPFGTWKHLAIVLYVFAVLWAVGRWTAHRLKLRNDNPFPAKPLPTVLASGAELRVQELGKRLFFLFTFAGIAFLFGLNAPILSSATGSQRVELVIMFALFLLGGVGTWVAALELASRKGIWYVVGFLLGTAPIYAVTAALGFLLVSCLLSVYTDAAGIYLLKVYLQVATGVLLIFTSFAVSGASLNSASSIRYAAVCALFVPLIGLWLQRMGAQAKHVDALAAWLSPGMWTTTQTLLFVAVAVAMVFMPLLGDRLRIRRESSRTLYVAVPNHLAIAPLIMGSKGAEAIQPARWRNITLCLGGSARLFSCDSDEEVAYLLQQYSYRSLAAGSAPDVAIMDIFTALATISRKINSPVPGRGGYVLCGVIGCVPWRFFKRTVGAGQFPVLVPGFLGYDRNALEASYSPCHDMAEYEVPTGFGSALAYALRSREIDGCVLPEPHASLAELHMDAGGLNLSDLASYCDTKDVTRLAARMPYVILRRQGLERGLKASAWMELTETILQGMESLRRNHYVIDVERAGKIAEFLNAMSDREKFSSPVIDKALRGCSYGPRLDLPSAIRHAFGEAQEAEARLRNLWDYCRKLKLGHESNENFEAKLREKTWYGEEISRQVGVSVRSSALLYPIIVVWVENSPGKLHAVLQALTTDLLLINTTSAGEYGLICAIPRPHADGKADCQLAQGQAFDFVKAPPEAEWNAQVGEVHTSLQGHKCVVRSAAGLLVKIHDHCGGLREGLQALCSAVETSGPGQDRAVLNLEGVCAFPFTNQMGLGLVLMSERDLERTITLFDVA